MRGPDEVVETMAYQCALNLQDSGENPQSHLDGALQSPLELCEARLDSICGLAQHVDAL
jgi:hypothetical protein